MNHKKYSLENLHATPQQIRELTGQQLKNLVPGCIMVGDVADGKYFSFLHHPCVTLPRHTHTEDLLSKIAEEQGRINRRHEAARDFAVAQNTARRYVMKFGEKY